MRNVKQGIHNIKLNNTGVFPQMQDMVQRLSRDPCLTPGATEGSHPGVKVESPGNAKHTCPEGTDLIWAQQHCDHEQDIKPGLY